MERLTYETTGLSGVPAHYQSPCKKQELIDRLAKYEDTGLEPSECEELGLKHFILVCGDEGVWRELKEDQTINIYFDTEEERNEFANYMKSGNLAADFRKFQEGMNE